MQLVIDQGCIDAADRARWDDDFCCICPTAQALIRDGYKDVAVGKTIAFADGHRWPLPEATQTFISDWDAGRPVRPVTLELEEET